MWPYVSLVFEDFKFKVQRLQAKQFEYNIFSFSITVFRTAQFSDGIRPGFMLYNNMRLGIYYFQIIKGGLIWKGIFTLVPSSKNVRNYCPLNFQPKVKMLKMGPFFFLYNLRIGLFRIDWKISVRYKLKLTKLFKIISSFVKLIYEI